MLDHLKNPNLLSFNTVRTEIMEWLYYSTYKEHLRLSKDELERIKSRYKIDKDYFKKTLSGIKYGTSD